MSDKRPRSRKHQPKGMEILHEDRDIIVVNKAAGVPTIGTGRDAGRTAHAALNDYVRKGNPKSRERAFIVHRLDRDTSGVLVFARTEDAKFKLQSTWEDTDKIYLAFVEGHPDPPEGTITSYLAENSALRVYSTTDPKAGKLSHTRYRVIRTTTTRALLEIALLTGRKNQIRVHLADKGWPIVGDSKYGPKSRERMALHSYSLTLVHPFSGETMTFQAPPPAAFHYLGAAPRPARRPPAPAPSPEPPAKKPKRPRRG